MSVTVRGKAKVQWRPDFTVLAESPDGLELDADGNLHDLTATLTNTADGSPVADRVIQLSTSPVGNVGDGSLKRTSSSGVATFRVSKSTDGAVTYTASLIPNPPSSSPAVTDDVTIVWGTAFYLFSYPSDSTSPSGADFGPVELVLSTTDVILTPAVGESITVTPIGVIGAIDGTGHLTFMLPDHAPGAVVYTLTVPTLSSGLSSVSNVFTHTWT